MNDQTKLKAYELMIDHLEDKLQKTYQREDDRSGEYVGVTRILLEEVFRLSGYANLLAVATRIDNEIYDGRVNYRDYVDVDFSEREAA